MILKVWPTIPALFALLLVVCDYFGRLSNRTPRTPNVKAWWWIGGLIVSYMAQLAIVSYAARHEYPMEPWRLTMPLPVVDKTGVEIVHANFVAGGMLSLGAFQSYALLGLYRSKPLRAAVWIGCGTMLVLSCLAPALISFDLYGYVQYALLGFKAYQLAGVQFSGEYHVFDLWHELPIAAPYGPLWLAIAPFVTSVAPSLLGKLIALRIFALALYLALLAGLRALGMPSRVRTVAALNPGLMLQYVANGHNDLVPIVLIVWAAASVRVQTVLAFALIAAAGLVKLPYVILGLPVVTGVRPSWKRIIGSMAMVAAVAVLSWTFGGSGYLGSLVRHVGEYPDDVAQHIAALVALMLILLAAVGLRRLRAAVWIIPMVSAALYPWYFIWGLPYALARRRILAYLLVCFPFVTMLVGLSSFLRVWELNLVLPAVVAICILAPAKVSQKAAAPP